MLQALVRGCGDGAGKGFNAVTSASLRHLGVGADRGALALEATAI